jgi:hypothetical protein
MTALQCLTFLPFLVILVFSWMRFYPKVTLAAWMREFLGFFAWLVPCGMVFSLILFCRLMRWLPHNSLIPGPLKDPMLENPPWGMLAGVLAAALAVGIGLHFLARFLARGTKQSFGVSRTLLMTFQFLVILPAWKYDPYWTLVYLAIPSLIWGMIGRGVSLGARLAGALAIPAAGIALYVAFFLAARDLGSGAMSAVYYAVLGLSNGLFSWQGYFLAAATAILGLRYLILQFSRTPE